MRHMLAFAVFLLASAGQQTNLCSFCKIQFQLQSKQAKGSYQSFPVESLWVNHLPIIYEVIQIVIDNSGFHPSKARVVRYGNCIPGFVICFLLLLGE